MPSPPTKIKPECHPRKTSKSTLVIIISIEIPRIYFTFLVAWLIKTFETTNIPMQAKSKSIKALSENPNGMIVSIGKTIQ